MRNVFIRELVKAAEKEDNIVLIVGDLGFGVVEEFSEKFPDRFFNAGVAEQNMMGMAAGLASEGYHVFVYSIANFPTLRCAEQIRNDIDYHQLPVTIVAVGGGLAYGNLGYSHHAIQDYAIMRSMPNMKLAAPGDPLETCACMKYLISNPQPSYLRLGKAGEPTFHNKLPMLSPGHWLPISIYQNSKKTLLTTGTTLEIAHKLVKENRELSDYSIHSMPLWGMEVKSLQIEQMSKWEKVITIEDHLFDAGFGSWLVESLITKPKLLERVKIKALDSEVCGAVGRQNTLNELGGITKFVND